VPWGYFVPYLAENKEMLWAELARCVFHTVGVGVVRWLGKKENVITYLGKQHQFLLQHADASRAHGPGADAAEVRGRVSGCPITDLCQGQPEGIRLG
jgi:hypothetical protein